MNPSRRPIGSFAAWLLAATAALSAVGSTASALDWTAYREDSVVEIITLDDDGARRETKIWIVVLDQTAFIRTNDSRWLANIRRDPAVHLRTRDVETSVDVEIDVDPIVYDRVEQAFKDKYGVMQRVMSAFRISRPTVMRLTPRTVR